MNHDFHAVIAGKLSAEDMVAIAAARKANEEAIDAEAARDGHAISRVRKAGVLGHYPPKKRQATSGCGPNNRKQHRDLLRVPAAA